jgi:hypothetical protein
LRNIARNNDKEIGYIKPHSGIYKGILSSEAGFAVSSTV